MKRIKSWSFLTLIPLFIAMLSTACQTTIWAKRYSNQQIASKVNKIYETIETSKEPQVRALFEAFQIPVRKQAVVFEIISSDLDRTQHDLPLLTIAKSSPAHIACALQILIELIHEVGTHFKMYSSYEHQAKTAYAPFLPKQHPITKQLKALIDMLEFSKENRSEFVQKAKAIKHLLIAKGISDDL